jgi:purine-cytosine permease-like protein
VRWRRKYVGQEWAARDVWVATAFLALLLWGVKDARAVAAAFALLVVAAAFYGIRHVRRVRRWKRDGPPEFWADKIR